MNLYFMEKRIVIVIREEMHMIGQELTPGASRVLNRMLRMPFEKILNKCFNQRQENA